MDSMLQDVYLDVKNNYFCVLAKMQRLQKLTKYSIIPDIDYIDNLYSPY